MSRHRVHVEALKRSVLEGEGETPRGLRQAAAGKGEVPPEWRAWVDKVRTQAYRITDEEVAALRRAGRSEDEIFEVTVAAAVGEGVRRLEAALAAIERAGA